jgi:hypothetical protein
LRYFIRVINSLQSANNAVPVVLCLVPPPSSDSDSPPPPELGFLFLSTILDTVISSVFLGNPSLLEDFQA